MTTRDHDSRLLTRKVPRHRARSKERPRVPTGLDLISAIEGGQATHYLTDGLGSTRSLADGGGAVADTYRYDAFGATIDHTGTADQPFLFTGEQQNTGVAGEAYYLRARYYDPALGRFWSQDPFGGFAASPQSLNPYAYVANRPLSFVDPWGLCGLSSWGDFGDCFEPVADPLTQFIECLADVSCIPEALGDSWVWVSNGIQILDIVPVGAIPVVGQVAGAVIDVAAFAAAEIDILRSSCPGKLGLTATNAVNLGEGLAGNLLSTAPNVLLSASEAGLYAGTTGALATCGRAERDGKE